MFHEILDDEEGLLREFNAGCTTALLEAVVAELRRAQWPIVTLDDGLARLQDDAPPGGFAILTFDDAYRDTLSRALPLLERLQAPFTVYVPTGAVTRDLFSWWLGLRALFLSRDTVSVSPMSRTFSCVDMNEKLAGYAEVRNWVHEDYTRVGLLAETFSSYGIALADLNERYFLDADGVRVLTSHPLITIGAHSTSHSALSDLEDVAAQRDLADNRSYLEGLLNRPVCHLAYPYGNSRACGEREYALAAALGFRSATTTLTGPLFASHCKTPHQLPRVGIAGTARHFPYIATTIREFGEASAHEFRAVDG